MKKEENNNDVNRKMNHKLRRMLALASLVASQSFAQYEIKKHTINSGGASMSGGNYQLTASIGQVDASNAMNSGSYNLTGGFWQPSSNASNEIIFANSFE